MAVIFAPQEIQNARNAQLKKFATSKKKRELIQEKEVTNIFALLTRQYAFSKHLAL